MTQKQEEKKETRRPLTGIKYGERLYQESINRVQKQEAQLIALNLMEA
jgi:hypothetical protein